MAYVVMAYIVVAYVVTAYIVMAQALDTMNKGDWATIQFLNEKADKEPSPCVRACVHVCPFVRRFCHQHMSYSKKIVFHNSLFLIGDPCLRRCAADSICAVPRRPIGQSAIAI